MKEKLYKVLNEDSSCFWGGRGKWSLPKGNKPGNWMPVIKGKLSSCSKGYHVLTSDQLILWLGPTIYEVEVKGKGLNEEDKSVYSQARLLRKLDKWNIQTARLFACDCAEHVLSIFENKYPNDNRPRKAIELSRLFAVNKATQGEMVAARDAAWHATRDSASNSAQAAWHAVRAAMESARAVAWVAARDAARAAKYVAGDSEREWQINLLKQVLDI